jgi:hypothetical protein
MTAYNVVRFRVKPGKDDEFIRLQKSAMGQPLKGMRKVDMIRTGDRAYCLVGEWEAMSDIAAARPAMIASLDKVRHLLEELGNDLGVTDPVSGEVVARLA